jgi:hypothetical protein
VGWVNTVCCQLLLCNLTQTQQIAGWVLAWLLAWLHPSLRTARLLCLASCVVTFAAAVAGQKPLVR